MPQNANDVTRDTIQRWLDAALQQVAAESYLDGISLQDSLLVTGRLERGNSPLAGAIDQFIRMTPAQATDFLNRYQVVDHHANDATGFSATVLRNKDTSSAQYDQYSLVFRSTEYKLPAEGGDYDRDGNVNLFGLKGADG